MTASLQPECRYQSKCSPGGAVISRVAAALLIAATTSVAQTSTSIPNAPGQGDPAQGQYAGSVASKPVNGVLQLSLQEAMARGMKQNLGTLLSEAEIRSSRGERWQQLSTLLPHVNAAPAIDVSKINLAEEGISLHIPGINFPTAVGPFSYFDARASLSQTLFNWKSINNTRAAGANLKASEFTYKDARDLVVLAVGFTYLQAVADEARVETAQAQVDSAKAVYDQASDQVKAGTSPDIDGLRAKVEMQTRQQQLIQARNSFAIRKLAVSRVIGLAPGQRFDLTDKSLYQPLEVPTVEDALQRAYASRSDYQAAIAEVRAAEYSRRSAVAGYFPSLSVNADYGTGGSHPSTSNEVFDVRGILSIPIFEGGSVHGDVLQADARLAQSRERLDNLRGQIDTDVRTALLNLESSAELVEVARGNIELAEATLTQSRDRFQAGVTDTVEVVQSQEAVASAHEQYISSLYNFNYAKISLARAVGTAEAGVKEYFKGKQP